LQNRVYRHGGYREFVVIDSKKRTIKAAPFRDRVVHHALCNIIEPILDRSFIFDSYACRVGKGTHRAVLRLERFIRALRGPRGLDQQPPLRVYCLKCDVAQYFASINHVALLRILERRIRDPEVRWLIREIIGSHATGIPIGNLTSQLFANVYLNELDHYVKRVLRVRFYLRYMDDFLILGRDKRELHELKELIRTFLRDQLALTLHPKKAEVFPIDQGIDFLGYVIIGNRRLLRRSTVRRFLKRQKRCDRLEMAGRLPRPTSRELRSSWRGYTTFANAYRLMEKLGLGQTPGGPKPLDHLPVRSSVRYRDASTRCRTSPCSRTCGPFLG
jgi:hypothetical protein